MKAKTVRLAVLLLAYVGGLGMLFTNSLWTMTIGAAVSVTSMYLLTRKN